MSKAEGAKHVAATAIALGAACVASNAYADDAPLVHADLVYTADYMAPVGGGLDDHGAFVDNALLTFTADLQQLAGIRGGRFEVRILNNSGGNPNDHAGTLQGVDNIEVTDQGLRLYQAWFEADVGAANMRLGLYDLNSEFYANDSAGVLLAPPFGIGSELAATGVNGPAIFPSTALALRMRAPLSAHADAKFALVNAHAGVLGDPHGVDFSFEDGVLLIGELSWTGDLHASVGGWTYSDLQADIRDPAVRHKAFGAYVTLEHQAWGEEGGVRNAQAFARIGLSDGDTTPYDGGWQAGLLVNRLIASRPGSQGSIGIYQGRFGAKQRANLRDAGARASSAETGIEFTVADQVTPWLRVQPDLQFVLDPAGDRDREGAWIAGLRVVITPFER